MSAVNVMHGIELVFKAVCSAAERVDDTIGLPAASNVIKMLIE
jgi:hypothetical protein